ncbi:ABC transporter substrate-binding protein [Paenibacillus sp. GD4]|uniref:ABC transporter substrate-binding protein n=1 Tax=Paenibacillus sp. GD4 TaxID=3068890 RepID=UPI0027967069|nr:ABC transporter substrate-binding protein [Paenibacillus sp. GD4]MDQ1910656.1 ABC transporter substrate-binding protein [Paenibacillus sp. GD4]
MKLASHYLRLREQYPHIREKQPLGVTLDELAGGLDCTHRNTQLLLKKMQELGWVDWEARRGRGQRSKLLFLKPADDLILDVAKDLVERKDLRGALEQMKVFHVPDSLKESFHHWLNGYFGYSSEVRGKVRFDLLRFPLTQPLTSLDPATIHFTTEAHLVHQLFDPLVRYNRLTQSIEPHLAHAWEADAERKAWTFHLRKGVLFHHGRELDAEDVVYTFERLKQRASGSLYSWVLRQIEAVEAIDPITVQFRLTEPNELFLQYAGTNRASILPADVCEELKERFALSPVGTGPFKLVKNDRSMCVLDVFPAYFQGRAHLDRVELWHMEGLEEQDRFRTLESFQILHNYRLPDEATGAWQQIQQQGTTAKFITFNLLKEGPLTQPELREAVVAALDRTRLLERLGGDAVYAGDSFLDSEQHLSMEAVSVAPTEVRVLLKQAGYTGERLSLCTIPQYERDALLVQALLQEAGLAVELRLLSAEEFKGEARLQADLLLFSIMLDNDAELRLIDLFKSMQRHVEPSVRAQIDLLLTAALRESERGRRTELLQAIESQLKAKRLLRLLYFKKLKTLYHSSVKGISLDSLDWVQFKNIWFKP